MKKYYILLVILATTIISAGCVSVEGKIQEELEQTAIKEKEFEKQQQPLMELEKKEKALFDQMLSLGMKEFDEITKLADEALANLDERQKLMDEEKKAMDASKEQFSKLNTEKLKDEALQKQSDALKKTMEARYQKHQELYEAYKEGLEEDRKIYGLMKDKDLQLDELKEQIDKSNHVYEKVMELNDAFNSLTQQFNEEKKAFYEAAGIQTKNDSDEQKGK